MGLHKPHQLVLPMGGGQEERTGSSLQDFKVSYALIHSPTLTPTGCNNSKSPSGICSGHS